MRTQDFDFYLPDALIAQHPAKTRSASRLLRLDGENGHLTDMQFAQFDEAHQAGDVIVFNDTRVIKARLFGKKASGGAIELMIERVLSDHEALTQIRASRAPKVGSKLYIADQFEAEVIARKADLFHIKLLGDTPIYTLLEQVGHLPLPPYITHEAVAEDETRYQTVFAKHAGAVAAPTAGLHFDEAMLERLRQRGVIISYITLHVGAGTFQPVKVDNILEHTMHSEVYHIPAATVAAIQLAKQQGKKVTAVGTTALRALESAAVSGLLIAGHNETNIFITPGFQFKVVDRLLTNFHLPKSTLLMLVSAFAGFDHVKQAYQHAVAQEYRFFSYGDAMLIDRARNAGT